MADAAEGPAATVADLIEELQRQPNQQLPVCVETPKVAWDTANRKKYPYVRWQEIRGVRFDGPVVTILATREKETT